MSRNATDKAVYEGFKMPFGPWKGQTLRKMSRTKKGLLYLDRLVDWRHLRPETKHMLKAFLATPAISQRIDEAIADDDDEEG